MKRRLIYFLCILFTSENVYSQEVKKDEVRLVANNFILQRNAMAIKNTSQQTPFGVKKIEQLYEKKSQETIAYIVNVEPSGFVVISNNTKIEPIIAYSFRHNWNPDTSQANIIYHMLQQDLRIRNLYQYFPK